MSVLTLPMLLLVDVVSMENYKIKQVTIRIKHLFFFCRLEVILIAKLNCFWTLAFFLFFFFYFCWKTYYTIKNQILWMFSIYRVPTPSISRNTWIGLLWRLATSHEANDFTHKKKMQQRISDLSALALFDSFYLPYFGISVQHAGLILQNKSALSISSLMFPLPFLDCE